MILLICSEKGGTGKTTLATNLAVAAAHAGRDVLLIDADAQASATRWADRRRDAEITPPVGSVAKTGKLHRDVRDLAQRYDDLIIDAGGRDSVEMRSAMLVADRILVPLRPSQYDIETLPHLAELIAEAGSMREDDPEAVVVLSQVPTHHLVREADDAREALEGLDGIEMSELAVAGRKAYRDAAIEGRGVVELGDEKATYEINRIYRTYFAQSKQTA